MSSEDKQLEIEALAAVGEMLLFDQARGWFRLRVIWLSCGRRKQS